MIKRTRKLFIFIDFSINVTKYKNTTFFHKKISNNIIDMLNGFFQNTYAM